MNLSQLIYHKLYCVYYVIVVYAVSAWFVLLQLLQPHKKPKIGNEKGRVALITGGGTGIGYETSLQLLEAGMTVVIVGIKNDQREGVMKLQKKYKEDQVRFLECDLSSLKSVRELASQFNQLKTPLHVLINNAGVMFAPELMTEEGFESHWLINYLSHFLLTHLLLKNLAQSSSKTRPSRIVNLSSCLHYPGTINFKDTQGRKGYSAEIAYTQSKLAMAIFATTLSRKLKRSKASGEVWVNAVHPAVAFSGLYRFIWWARLIPRLAQVILNTPAMGSDTVVHAAVSPEVMSGGKYFHNCETREPSLETKSVALGERLWRLSCSQAGIEKFEIVG